LQPRATGFYGRFEIVATSPALLAGALDLHVLHQLPYYDALIVHAAHVSRCPRVLTEAMAHGASHGGVQIVNPFAG
jgi:predicted nucleic acid-binding protein